MLESTPTGTRENGPYDMWDICLKEVEVLEKQEVFKYAKDENGAKKILTPRGVNEKGELEFSRLPELYAKVTRTPTFLKWFGDWTQPDKTNVSKVVHEDTSEPMVMLHGTKSNIQGESGLLPQRHEDPGRDGKIYFCDSIIGVQKNVDFFDKNNPAYLYSCFLNIKKPYNGHPTVKPYMFLKDGYLTRFNDRTYSAITSARQIMQLPSSV